MRASVWAVQAAQALQQQREEGNDDNAARAPRSDPVFLHQFLPLMRYYFAEYYAVEEAAGEAVTRRRYAQRDPVAARVVSSLA